MVLGSCEKIPVLCTYPTAKIARHETDKEFLEKLVRYRLPEMEISMPKDFLVIKERINKVYYKNRERGYAGNVSYLLYERPDFFVNLFPAMRKKGIGDDFEFISHTMRALPRNVDNLTDTFFVIMKSVFTPNLGDEANLKMVQFAVQDKKGFITYNLSPQGNYFDCNIINGRKDFFKVYIKDKAGTLSLDNVLSIVSTIKPEG